MPRNALPFGARLRELRAARGLTLARLAEETGMSLHGVAKLEYGTRTSPCWETVVALAAALGVTPDAFRVHPGTEAGPPGREEEVARRGIPLRQPDVPPGVL